VTPTISLHGVGYWYPNSAEPALHDVDLEAGAGLTLVAGDSGGGKSTLLRLLDGLVPQFHGGRVAGSARVAGLDPFTTPVRIMAGKAGLVFQDVETQSVYGTVEREIAFGLENAGMPRPSMHDRVDAALAALSIEHLRTRRLTTLSGGERQRVQLAAVLALEPEVIALDEPTSQLDRPGAEAFMAACRSLAAEGRAVVLAEHRLEDAIELADALVVVERGRVEGPGDPGSLVGRLASPPPLVELARELGLDALPLGVEEARACIAAATPGPPAAVRTQPRRLSRLTWQAEGLAIGPAGRPIVEGISMAIGAGEVLAVVGSNGSGKTTLLRTIAGLLAPIAGAVETAVERVAYVPQNPGALLHLPTLRAEVELTARRLGVPGPLDALLESFGLAGVADRYPRDLSSGQRQRGALAAALAGAPHLALLDEPTRGMDLAARRALDRVIRTMSEAGTSVVVATHDMELAGDVADRVVLLEQGRAVDLGGPEVALAAGTPRATQVARLLPGGPVTVPGAVAFLAARLPGTGVAAGRPGTAGSNRATTPIAEAAR
jgi:energy-coupling factor transporter ATP-binding protein EcfA2